MIMVNASTFRTGEDLSRDLTTYVLPVTVFISIEAFVGFFGNIAILLVYSCRYRRINFRYFVLALALVDITSCCTTLPGEVFSQLNWYNYQHAWICKVKSFFNVYTAWGSASILLSLAIDRYRKICHPCDWQIRCPAALKLCGCCLIVSLAVSTPVIILWGKQTYNFDVNGNNVTVSVCEKSGEYADTIYPLLFVCGVYLGPVGLMIVAAMTLNLITAWRLFGHHSMKATRISHHSMKAVGPITLTSESSENAIDINSETKTIINDMLGINAEHPAEKLNKKNYLPSFAKCQGHQAPRSKGKPSVEGFISDDARRIEICENSSTDYFSNDDEFTDDYSSGNDKTGTSSTDQVSSDQNRRVSRRSKRRGTQTSKFHRKRKTMIMLTLTSIFAVTLAMYIILTSLVAKPDGILKDMPGPQKAAFFFFWRLYFVNSVVNPILYGFMDPGFRSGFMSYIQRNKQSVTSSS